MNRLATILSEAYNKYLPLAEKSNIYFNLDFTNITTSADDPEQVKKDLDEQLQNAFKHSKAHSEIKVTVRGQKIIISDPNTVLSKAACALLSNPRIQVQSRVGFGTKITILLKTPQS